jgi:hypothetical protein
MAGATEEIAFAEGQGLGSSDQEQISGGVLEEDPLR